MDIGYTVTLADLKTWNIGLVNQIFSATLNEGLIYNGHTYATDAQSQQAITNLGSMCSSLIGNNQASQTFTQYDINGVGVVLTSLDMVLLAAQLRQFVAGCYTTRQTHITNINATIDIPTLSAYDVTINWPSNSLAPTVVFPTVPLVPAIPATPPSNVATGSTNILVGGPGGAVGGDGGPITVHGGVPTNGSGGAANLIGADGTGPIGNGGNVLVQAGNTAGGTAGSITFKTSYTTRLVIGPLGDWAVNGNIGISGQVLTSGGVGAQPSWTSPSGSGTVTSVALAEGSTTDIYAITGSPVIGSGTLTFTLVNQTANTIFAGPTTGVAVQPTFRVLVAADIPAISLTTGVSGTLPVGSGGTGVGTSTGTGSVVLANTPTLVTPVLGAATGTSLALGGGSALTTTSQTGTGSLVLANTPTLVTPVLGAATGTSLALGGGTALTSTNQTGTGSLVLANTPTLVTPVLGAATGTSLALGGGTALTTTNRTGTGNLVLATSPALTTPDIGVATGTSLALGGGTALTTTNRTGTGNLVLATSPTLATPVIGVATGTSLAVTGLVTSSGTAGIGYATGAGGTVTQATSRTTGVTLSKICGTITTNTTSLAALAAATFTVTNTLVAINDVVLVSQRSGATNVKTDVRVTAVAAGSFNITIHNIDAATAEVGAIIINFVVIKAVVA